MRMRAEANGMRGRVRKLSERAGLAREFFRGSRMEELRARALSVKRRLVPPACMKYACRSPRGHFIFDTT